MLGCVVRARGTSGLELLWGGPWEWAVPWQSTAPGSLLPREGGEEVTVQCGLSLASSSGSSQDTCSLPLGQAFSSPLPFCHAFWDH